MQEIPTRYDPKSTEKRLYEKWESAGYFSADPRHSSRFGGEREAYVIVIPPPNVTAVLHMGHGLNNTIQDVLIRWQRMKGREALWIPGTDHAGIATQNVVERQLAAEGKTRQDVGRDAFVERVWTWVDKTGGTILEQLRAIGSSCDWSRTAFTLDEGLSRAVREVFVRLYERDLIYRGNYIINWCPRCLTALSNEEAEPEETQGRIWRLRYPLARGSGDGKLPRARTGTGSLPTLPDGRQYIVVATTRPETMLGDTGVAVNPADERYIGLHGALVDLPLTGRRIPIVADDYADPEFGSGAVKLTPAHDPNDFEVARRHDLAMLDVMTPDARMNENAPAAFQGLDRFEARKRVVAAFEEAGLLEAVEEHTHAVPHCYRCGTIVEPRLSEQWFVKMAPLAENALRASREGHVRFTPERWKKVYEHWLENIRDWTISRQLWWGHRIPVWYCQNESCAEMIVSREDPTSCPKCGGAALEQDPDVLDTWFSSWLWPFSTMGWPDETPDLAAFYPTSALSTAPEILFFWVARMIMAGQEFMGRDGRTGDPMDGVPFQDVYLHGTVRDHLGRKMSKSLGNGIDPLEVVDRFGADALRFTLLAQAGVGTDILMNPTDLEETFSPGRNFANKLWNAGRFALMNMGEDADVQRVDEVQLELTDRWILSRAQRVTAEVEQQLSVFRFADVAETLRQFFWGEVADWYLELVKPRLYGDAGETSRDAARATLVEVMDVTLRLLHPLVPFITEELWLRLPQPRDVVRADSLVIAPWPLVESARIDADAEQTVGALIELVSAVRTLRAEYNVPPAQELTVLVGSADPALADAVAREDAAIRRLARLATPTVSAEPLDTRGRAGAHAVLRSGADVFIPLEGIIDIERERARLGDELARIEGQITATERKLENRQFVDRAPADVVDRERDKAASFRDQRERLSAKLAALS